MNGNKLHRLTNIHSKFYDSRPKTYKRYPTQTFGRTNRWTFTDKVKSISNLYMHAQLRWGITNAQINMHTKIMN